MARVQYKSYEIETWVELYDSEDDFVAKYCESLKEAKHYQHVHPQYSNYAIRWAAAEIINKDGDVNPSVNGATKKEALDKLKKVL
jgi:hypothetical protein